MRTRMSITFTRGVHIATTVMNGAAYYKGNYMDCDCEFRTPIDSRGSSSRIEKLTSPGHRLCM